MKKYFDLKVPILFLSIFLLSSIVLIIKMNSGDECNIKEFQVDAPSFKVGELIIFSDASKKSHSWRWYFGDNTQISFRLKVAHSFMEEGEYLVKLIVNNECTIQKVITILPKENSLDKSKFPKFRVPGNVMQDEEVEFVDRTDGAKSWEWRFGESGKVDSFDEKCTYVFTTPGKKVVSLVVNNDYKHVTIKELFVIPKKKEVVKVEKYKSAIPWNPFKNVPDAPPEEEKDDVVKVVKGPEIGGTDARKLEDILESVAKGKTNYESFLKHFCKYNLPIVIYKDAKTSSLKEFFYAVKKKGDKVKNVTIQKDGEDCIRVINIDKKHKSYF